MRKEIVTSCLAVTKESCNFKKKKKKRRRRKDEGNTVPLSQPDQETQVKNRARRVRTSTRLSSVEQKRARGRSMV